MNQRKIAAVAELKDLLTRAKNVAVVDYSGMTVTQAVQLRRAIKAAGGLMKISKNTLFKIAAGRPDLNLTGLSAFVFSLGDEISALKAIKLPFKLGLASDRVLSAAEIESLAKTPVKETSIAKLTFLLQYYTSSLVRTLDTIAKKEVTN